MATDLLWTARKGDWCIVVLKGAAGERRQLERELLRSGTPLPFASRFAVASIAGYSAAAFVAVLDPQGNCAGGFAVLSRPAPLLRRHHLLRVEQFGSSIPMEAADAAVAGMLEWVRRDKRALRLSVDVFSFDEQRRQVLGRVLAGQGFRRAEHVNGYTETLVIDLAGSEEELFRSLHHSARRKIRQLEKQPVAIRLIDDPALSDRMNQLLVETFARTGGRIHARDWERRIALSCENPELSRIVGLFRTDTTDPDSLLAFAWGCHGVDHVYYSEAASTRATDGLRVAVAYGLMWDLIVWAKRTGARVFDLGGVTAGKHTDEDPLGGISDFKRYFSQQALTVRDEWILDDLSWKASFVAAVHSRVRRR